MTQTSKAADQMVIRFNESARWADYGNDGSDRAATRRYFAWSTAAKVVAAQGITEAAAADLAAQAQKARNAAEAHEFEGGYGWLDRVEAEVKDQAAEQIRREIAAVAA